MTCIVGYVEDGVVYLGGDSAGVSGYDLVHRADSKVFRKGKMVFGFTSSFRMGNLLRFKLDIPKQKKGVRIYQYMCTDFVDAVIKCLRDNHYAKDSNGQYSGGVFMVGYKGRLFKIDSDFQVAESLEVYDACGCGESLALGAMYAIEDTFAVTNPYDTLSTALSAACHFSAGVSEPFNFVSTAKDD